MQIVLASASPYRHELLRRLGIEFAVHRPDIDESRAPAEPATALVTRLSRSKARAVAAHYPDALIIGSDQVAVVDTTILTKPGNATAAIAQLLSLRGRTAEFYTGLCVINTATGNVRESTQTCAVTFRDLSPDAIARYVARDQPYDCAGAFKSEALGIALTSRISSDDPTALVGLPLIALVAMLAAEGVDVP